VLILLFVAYQLWGTGIREAQAQDRLERRFNDKLAQASEGEDNRTVSSTTTTSDSSASTNTIPPTTAGPLDVLPAEGEPIGRIEIPRIGLSAYVVEGVGDDDLHQGPGHYPGTPLPGQKGNASIAGHRTTYGAPFANIDDLAPGDEVTVTTLQGTFTYAVMQQEDGSGHIIVSPDQVEVLNDVGDNRLTLTACHPRYSASQRIIVFAALKGQPKPAPARPIQAPKPALSGLSGEGAARLPVFLFGLLCTAIWVGAWLLGKRWRKWPAYFVGFPFFMVALFYFFENFSRLLPSNF
jgi:sortase A